MTKTGLTAQVNGGPAYDHIALSVGSEAKVTELADRLRTDGYSLVDGPRWTGDGYFEAVVLELSGLRVEITI